MLNIEKKPRPSAFWNANSLFDYLFVVRFNQALSAIQGKAGFKHENEMS